MRSSRTSGVVGAIPIEFVTGDCTSGVHVNGALSGKGHGEKC